MCHRRYELEILFSKGSKLDLDLDKSTVPVELMRFLLLQNLVSENTLKLQDDENTMQFTNYAPNTKIFFLNYYLYCINLYIYFPCCLYCSKMQTSLDRNVFKFFIFPSFPISSTVTYIL